jgi:hypothetical protein
MFGRITSMLVRLGAVTLLTLAPLPGGVASAGMCPISIPQGSEPVTIDPANFVEGIDNAYLPMTPGARAIFRETDPDGGTQKVKVVVTTRTKEILGLTATVVHDLATEHGQWVENTFDWYAQDVCGNVWYLGENTKEYEDGVVVSTAGSWEAGVNDAQPGVVMPADPQVGLSYRQEYYAGEAEDAATILSLTEQAQVPYGHFSDVILTREYTPLHPKVLEYKLYTKGIGVVLAVGISGGSDREELIRFESP